MHTKNTKTKAYATRVDCVILFRERLDERVDQTFRNKANSAATPASAGQSRPISA